MDREPYYGQERSRAASGRPGSARHSSAPQRRPAPGYDGRSANRRPADVRRNPPPRRRRRKDPATAIARIVLVLLVAAALIYVGSAWLTAAINKSTFCDNVYINNISMTDCRLEDAPQYLQDQIAARLSKQFTLTLGSSSWSFSAADFNAAIDSSTLIDRAWNIGHVGNFFSRAASIRALKENPIYLNGPLTYDESLIDAFVERLYNETYIAPENATVVIDLEQPYLTSESSRGQELDRETAKAQIISLIETGEGGSELPMIVLEPALSTDAAAATMNVIVEYKTDTSARGYNSRYNVRKGLSYFNGLTVYPGDTIDFNAIVGPRIESRGWKSATEYVGNTTQEGFGGGICQASTTLYGAMLKSGMTIIERWPHSMTVSYVDPSLDAAVTDTSKNLVFRNDTQHPIYIYTEVTKEYACVTVYGNRPEYRYELYSNIVSQDTAAVKASYIDDTEGKYVYYTSDPPVLYKKGLAALTSDGYLIGYDWETNEEVTSLWLSHDIYDSGTDIYWRGVHSRNEAPPTLVDFSVTTATTTNIGSVLP